MLNLENFSWGIIVGLFAVVILLTVVFGFSVGFGFDPTKVPLVTLLGFNVALILLESGIAIYILGVQKGLFSKKDRIKDLLLQLNAVKSAREDVEKGFFSRKLGRESRDEILRDLKKRELELKNQIELMKEREGSSEGSNKDEKEVKEELLKEEMEKKD